MFLSGKAGRWHSLSKDKRYDFCVAFLRYIFALRLRFYVLRYYDLRFYDYVFFFFTFLRYDLQQFYLFVLFYLYVYLSL